MRRSSVIPIDRTIHEPTRLGIIMYLARCGGKAPFVDVRRELDIKHSGALSVHSRKLEDAGIIEADKVFVGRTPRTWLVLTNQGRQALALYKAALDAVTDVTLLEESPG